MQPLISVIIPTYKFRGNLSKSIDSVLNQDYTNLEIIVIDDNEPESNERKSTSFLMDQYSNDNRVRYIKHEKNKNGAAARNTGIYSSKGSYIAFLDDDDSFLPGKITKQVNYLEYHKGVNAVYCFATQNGHFCKTLPLEGDVSKSLLLLESKMFTPTLMFRKEALINIKGFDETFFRHQDYDLLLRYFDAGNKIGCITEILTELGSNDGDNIPKGKKLEEIKRIFFDKFLFYIEKYENMEKGFKNRVLAKHYAGVFLSHLKNGYLLMAILVFIAYFYKSPIAFLSIILSNIKARIK